jgi:hypothetical protein
MAPDPRQSEAAAMPPLRQFRRQLKSAALVIAVSSIIAVILTLTQDRYSAFPEELLISNVMGACIWALVEGLHRLSGERIGLGAAMLVGVPGGLLVGGKLATLFGAYDVIGAWMHDPIKQWKFISVSLLFAASAAVFVVLFWRATNYRLELEVERRRSAEAGRLQAIAELAALQAQIEPHFLFNTLAHVQSAIDEDPTLGKAVLEHLIRYLRGTLRRSRRSFHALGEELELIESLLAIAATRLGARLRYRIVVAESLSNASMPPLLLQPLVENAIKHGVEAAIEGGEILVQAEKVEDVLVLTVRDTGAGFADAAPEGVGLSNVRARLSSLYGDQGRLTLLRNHPRGLSAELRLPLRISS